MPQCFAEPENAFQIENWRKFLDFLVNFWIFFLLISSFLDLLTVFFVKNHLIWPLLFDNLYIQCLFLPRCNFVL